MANVYVGKTLSGVVGSNAVEVSLPNGNKIQLLPELRKTGMVPAADQFWMDLVNPMFSGVHSQGALRILLNPKQDGVGTESDIQNFKDRTSAQMNALKLIQSEEYVAKQEFLYWDFSYTIQDLQGNELYGLPSSIFAKMYRDKVDQKNKLVIDELKKCVDYFTATGYKGYKNRARAGATPSYNTYKGGTTGILNRHLTIDGKDSETLIKTLGGLTYYISKIGAKGADPFPETDYPYLNGTLDDYYVLCPRSVFQNLILNGNRLASEIGNFDRSTGRYNNRNKIMGTTPIPNDKLGLYGGKEILFMIVPKGVFSPVLWMSKTGLNAFTDAPDTAGRAALTHRITQSREDFAVAHIKAYAPLVFIVTHNANGMFKTLNVALNS